MITAVGLIAIILLYIIPLNLVIYNLSIKISRWIFNLCSNSNIEIFRSMSSIHIFEIIDWIIYIIIVCLLLILLRIILYLLQRYFYIKKNFDLYDHIPLFLEKYNLGLRGVNMYARITVVIIITVMLYFKIYDVRIYVFAILLFMFGFKNYKVKIKSSKEKTNNSTDKGKKHEDYHRIIQWQYIGNTISGDEITIFKVNFNVEDKELIKINKNYFEKNIYSFSQDIKAICEDKDFSKKDIIEVVLQLISRFRKANYKDDNFQIEKSACRVLYEEEGTPLELVNCASEILKAMDFDVIESKLPYDEDNMKIVLFVNGADLEKGENYYTKDGIKYYYCELLAKEKYYIGEQKEVDDNIVAE